MMTKTLWIAAIGLALSANAAAALITDFNGPNGNSDIGFIESSYATTAGNDDFLYMAGGELHEMWYGRYGSYDRGGADWNGVAPVWYPTAGDTILYALWNISDADTNGTSAAMTRTKSQVRIWFLDVANNVHVNGYVTWEHDDVTIDVGQYATIALVMADIDGAIINGRQFNLGVDRVDGISIRADGMVGDTGGLRANDYIGVDNIRVVPEPMTLALFVGGLAAVVRRRR